MKSFAIKTSCKLSAALFLVLFCVGLGYAETKESKEPFTISVINNTDIVMVQATYWINHGFTDYRGPYNICVAELQPGADQTFNFGIAASGTRVFVTTWVACGDHYNKLEEYRSRVVSEVPEGTSIVKIYHKHFELVPIVEDSSQK
jgi:hypothetical protein